MEMDFATAGRIIFGNGSIYKLPKIIRQFGSRLFVVLSKSALGVENIVKDLNSDGIIILTAFVSGEPDTEVIDQLVESARRDSCDVIAGIGGGSVIDAGKAVAALVTNSGEILDYLEVVGKGNPLKNPTLPYIAVPTTAGTGSEVTKNAVISVPEKSVKVSMRSIDMIPDVALVDPELTASVPPEITASTGMDAFTQVLEPYVSNKRNNLVDLFCRDAIPRAARFLINAFRKPDDKLAREQMSWVSLMGGLALANGKLGAVHGFAGPLGGMYHQPHGNICAALLPAVMGKNVEFILERDENDDLLDRYHEIAVWITGNNSAKIEDIFPALEEIKNDLGIPGLSELGIKKVDYPDIVEKAKKSSSMKGNPVLLEADQMVEILDLAF